MADFPVVFDGEKYDIKQFLRDHPGGVDTLAKFRGKSVGQAMSSFGHSSTAYHLLKDFRVDNDVNLTGKVSVNGRIVTKEESKRNLKEIAFLEELEGRLDWSKPLLSQLEAIAPHYGTWVNSAVYRRATLFANPVLESMTFTPWYLVPMFWVPIILYLAVTQVLEHVACGESCSKDALGLLQVTKHWVAGVVIWTALEYSLHRCRSTDFARCSRLYQRSRWRLSSISF